MPPHLHPRSRMTSSLFATTVAASFLVVGLPHLLPCPAPRVTYADSSASPDGGGRRRPRRRSSQQTAEVRDGIAQFEGAANDGSKSGGEAGQSPMTSTAPRGKRECPVPKPSGVIGELIGFKKEEHGSKRTSRSAPGNAAENIQDGNDR
ncbi:hypothetical protein GGS24DRAFT_498981 [Hypoxylon argillaceum]|nr:hypothetical protein GGS24DRAFT_498981 [Hypoxylon argillaceum]KAI1151952.1 hypothetical protein F4825DRAFT_420930 [Nemania diffusa]